MKLRRFSIAIALLAFTHAGAQTADEILQKHATAMGGTENWDKITSVKMVGNMSMQGMQVGLTQTTIPGKAMRTDLTIMGMTGFTIVTNNKGWMYMPFQGATTIDTMPPDMVASEQRQLDFKSNQFLDYKSSGVKAEYIGKDTANAIQCYKVKFTDKDGNETVSYFDINTYYLVRSVSALKAGEVDVVYDKYKKMDEGVVMPMSVVAQGTEITFSSIELNKPIPESAFIPAIDKK